ncbi:MAG: glyoxalase/bleomycin resistance/extradiol dioxygenase family protein [Proteobacteria bacterium]|nr:glyoxalase/bleomycin resistance/extradiol dioxygenase family protein [Pseudomonadota bacterium]
MVSQIFVNLPVKQLDRAVAFFSALGYTFDPKFTNDSATCMIVGDNIFVMLLVEPFFRSFIDKEVCDARTATESITCLALDSRDQVDALLDKALAAGAREPRPAQDHGFMYLRGYEDLDGHLWELMHMSGEPS